MRRMISSTKQSKYLPNIVKSFRIGTPMIPNLPFFREIRSQAFVPEVGELFYQVKWKGFDELTWEPAANLNHLRKIIAKFQQSVQDAMAEKESSPPSCIKQRLKKQSCLDIDLTTDSQSVIVPIAEDSQPIKQADRDTDSNIKPA